MFHLIVLPYEVLAGQGMREPAMSLAGEMSADPLPWRSWQESLTLLA